MKKIIINKKKMKNTTYIVFGTFALALFTITRVNPSYASDGLILDNVLDAIAEGTTSYDSLTENNDPENIQENEEQPEISTGEENMEGEENNIKTTIEEEIQGGDSANENQNEIDLENDNNLLDENGNNNENLGNLFSPLDTHTENISPFAGGNNDCFDYSYIEKKGGVEITKYNCNSKNIDFSNGIDGYNVVSVASRVFYSKGIESVNLGNYLETIGDYAFYNNNITEIELPNSLKTIRNSAFSNNKIEEITLPEGLESIGDYVFSSNNITEMELSSSLKTIGRSAFSNNKIEEITLPEGLESIGEAAFSNNKINSLEIPGSVISIGVLEDPNNSNGAFQNNNISSLKINTGVKIIGRYSFKNNHITSLTIPNTVESIGESAFESNDIIELNMPDEEISVGRNAFAYNKIPDNDAFSFDIIDGLKTIISYGGNSKRIIIPNGTEAIAKDVFKGLGIEELELNEGLKIIGNNAFTNNNITNLVIPSTVERLGDYAFDGNFTSLSFNGDPGKIYYGYSALGSYSEAEDDTFKYLLSDKKIIVGYKGPSGVDITIPNGVVGIYSKAFSSKYITSVIFPDTLETIGDNAFNSCLIQNLDLPDSLIYVANFAFYSNQLQNINFGSGIKEIGEYAFSHGNCQLKQINLPDSLLKLGDGVFSTCPVESVNFGNSVKYIGQYAFQNAHLTEVYIPESVTYMGAYSTFIGENLRKVNAQGGGNIEQCTFGCSNNIKELETGPGVKSIGDNAFMSKKIEKLILGSGLISIGQYAFQSTLISGELIIPDTVTSIGRGTFNDTKVTSIVVGSGVKILPYMVFQGNSSNKTLENVILPEGLEEIGDYALADTNISNIKLPSTIKKIGANAFARTINLREIVFPEGLESIGDSAFCDSNRGENVKAYITENPSDTLAQQAIGACVDLKMAYRVKYRSEIETYQENFEDEIVEENKTAHQPFSLDNIEGYTFGWFKEGEVTPYDFTNPVTGDLELVAKFIKNKYKITYLEENGEEIEEKIIEYDDNIPITTLTKEGYTFIGWNGLTENGKMPAHDITLTANRKINQYKIIFDTDGGNEINPIEREYSGSLLNIILPTPVKECNDFSGWNTELPEIMPAHDITLKAIWNYTCSRASGGGGSKKSEPTTSEVTNDTTQEHNSAEDSTTKPTSDTTTAPLNEGTSKEVISVTQEIAEDGTEVEVVVEAVAIKNTNIVATVRTETPVNGTTSSTSSNSSSTTHTKEQTDAYSFAKANGITTTESIETAKMNTELTRIQMAKMLSNFAINVLGEEPDVSKGTVDFDDVTNKMDEQYDNAVTKAYQLGIMGQNVKDNEFRPNDEVSRAEFTASLSRLLYKTDEGEYKGTNKYYVPHIAKLYNEGIVNKADPKIKEKRGYVMTMLKRTVE